MVTALGVDRSKDSGVGMDAITHRRIIGAHWENLGVVAGLAVSGAAGLRYQAAAGVAVCSTGGADGSVEAYWPGGLTAEAVRAGDGAYGRIDSVYLLADTGAGGQVSLHVAQGVPSASPAAPALPAGALLLREMLLPAGASSTQSAAPQGSVDYAIPYGASMGLLGVASNDSSLVQDWTPGRWWGQAAAAFTLPTDRLVEVRFVFRAECDTGTTSCYARVRDAAQGDRILTDGMDECLVPLRYQQRQTVSWVLSLEAGWHNILVDIRPNTNGPAFWWRGLRQVEVWDRGVAR